MTNLFSLLQKTAPSSNVSMTISRSFDSGPSEACLARMRDNVLLLHTRDGRLYLFCSRTQLCIALALGCYPWDLIIIASRTEFVVQEFVYDKPRMMA